MEEKSIEDLVALYNHTNNPALWRMGLRYQELKRDLFLMEQSIRYCIKYGAGELNEKD